MPYARRSYRRSLSSSSSSSSSRSGTRAALYRRSISRSSSRSRSRNRSRSQDSSDVENPGNSLYVTGLSPRMTKDELERHFSSEGRVIYVHLVVDPWTRESRGFGFVTMASVEDAERCLKYLDESLLEGRVISVEMARRRRGRTPTPGRYLGLKSVRARRRSPSYSPYRRGRYSSSPDYSRKERYYNNCTRYRRRGYYRGSRRSCSYDSRSPSRSVSPDYSHGRWRRQYRGSPEGDRGRRCYSSDSRSSSRSASPYCRRRYRSPTPRLRRSKRSPSDSPSLRRGGRYSRESYSHSRSLSSYSSSSSSR